MATDVATFARIAAPIPLVQARGRRVTGSTSVPAMQTAPMPAQTKPARVPVVTPDRLDTAKAATGIGQGAATPAPQPARSAVRMESGRWIPSGSPGTLFRIDIALPKMVAPANAHAANRSCGLLSIREPVKVRRLMGRQARITAMLS